MTIDPNAERLQIIRRAKLNPDKVYSALQIAKALELGVAFYPQHVLRGLDALRFYPRGRAHKAEIALRRGMVPIRRAWCILHEIGEDHLELIGYREADVEQMANAIAACLQMPAGIFTIQARDAEHDLSDLATQFASTQTAVALRLAEVGELEAAVVVTPHRVYARAMNEEFVLPDADELRRIARRGNHPGLRKVAITDDRKRTALMA
jgi:hypothetical protein